MMSIFNEKIQIYSNSYLYKEHGVMLHTITNMLVYYKFSLATLMKVNMVKLMTSVIGKVANTAVTLHKLAIGYGKIPFGMYGKERLKRINKSRLFSLYKEYF